MRQSLLALSLLAASPSYAQLDDFVNDRPGFYLGGGVAFTNVYASGWASGTSSSESGDSDYGSIVNGGYRFNPWFAVELGYLDGGTPDFNDTGFDGRVDTEVDLAAWQLAGIGTWPVAERWELYIKLGVSAWDADGDQLLTPVGGPPVSRREDRNGPGFLLGIGLGVTLLDHLHARLEYQTFGIDDEMLALDAINTGNDDASFDSVTLQLHYRFSGPKKSEPLDPPGPRGSRRR